MKLTFVFLFFLNLNIPAQIQDFPWLNRESLESSQQITDIKPSQGFQRQNTATNSFASWLQSLPLKNKNYKVRLFDGSLKYNQDAHYRVLNIDVGKQDLQQCADAVMRLRSEYLYSRKEFDKVHFNFTSGDTAKFSDWIKGFRPKVNNKKVKWIQSGKTGSSYSNFRKYLKTVFMYAGSYSLKKELNKVSEIKDIQIGDVFIQGGFPGHAVIVIDLAISEKDGSKVFLLAQSYMPAQEIHILKNYENSEISPWYKIKETDKLYTPEWTFEWSDLYRFKD